MISSVNVTKSVGNRGSDLITFTEEILNTKLHFLRLGHIILNAWGYP